MDKIDDELKGQIDEIRESSDGVADVFDKVIHIFRRPMFFYQEFSILPTALEKIHVN